jgi:hypothetical protein
MKFQFAVLNRVAQFALKLAARFYDCKFIATQTRHRVAIFGRS